MDSPRRALTSSSSLWIPFQSPNMQRVPCSSHPVPRTCGQWAEQEGHAAGDGRTEAASALWLTGLLFRDHKCGWVARDAQWLKERAGKGSVWHCSGDLMPQAAPHQYPRAGWGQGWWHQPGRLEALCCLSCTEQETLAAEAAKCFVIHPSPSGIFPGQPLCPSSRWLGAHSEPSTGQRPSPPLPQSSLAHPPLVVDAVLLWREGWDARLKWKLICVPQELEAIIALTSSGN